MVGSNCISELPIKVHEVGIGECLIVDDLICVRILREVVLPQ